MASMNINWDEDGMKTEVVNTTGQPDDTPTGPSRRYKEIVSVDFNSIKLALVHNISAEAEVEHVFKTGEATDLQIHIGDEVAHVNFDLLYALSDCFQDFKERPTVLKIPVHVLSMRAFRKMYKWMLEDNPTVNSYEDFIELMHAADLFQVKQLNETLSEIFGHATLLANDEAVSTYIHLLRIVPNFQSLKTTLIGRFKYAFLYFVSHSDFVELSCEDLIEFLQCNTIAINTELEIIYAAIRWLNGNWQDRHIHLPQILDAIRFCDITSEELAAFTLDRSKETQLFRSSDGCQEKLKMLIGIHFKRSFTNSGDKDGGDCYFREWLHDRLCSYHHGRSCSKQSISYENFMKYMRLLVTKEIYHWRTCVTIPSSCCQNPDCINTEVNEVNKSSPSTSCDNID